MSEGESFALESQNTFPKLRKFNSSGFRASILEFLELDRSSLDLGYSAALQAEALARGGLAQATAYLLTDSVQDELDRLVCKAEVTSMDVERKHFHDKCQERGQAKIRSLGRLSRNCMLRRYRSRRSSVLSNKRRQTKKWKKERFMNLRAIAASRRPDLLPRPRGALHWEAGISAQKRRAIEHPGDREAFDAYVDLHREELKQEAAQRRAAAEAALTAAQDIGVPVSNAQWLMWVNSNTDFFHQCLRGASEDRRSLSHRVFVDNAPARMV